MHPSNPTPTVPSTLSLEQQICYAMHTTVRAFDAVYRDLLSEHGLSYPQYIALMAVAEHGPLTVTRLGEHLRLDSGTLSPLLKRMETGGLLERRRGHDDERRVTVHLTPSGHRLRERAPAVQQRVLEASGLTAAEMETLRALARRIGGPADPDAADRPGADSTGTRTTTTDTQE